VLLLENREDGGGGMDDWILKSCILKILLPVFKIPSNFKMKI
jgi:hypothetical protein